MMEYGNFFVVSGGPGSGKTSIIERLAARGFATVEESGRAILAGQAAVGGTSTHTFDPVAFRDLMLQRDIDNHERMRSETDAPVFFDRGVTELVGYCRLIGIPIPAPVRRAAELYRYNATVFVTPPWPEIYTRDALRTQDMDEAVRTFELCVEAYREFGYAPVEVPKAPVSERVAFVLKHVDAALASA